jgi:hypothetical protein
MRFHTVVLPAFVALVLAIPTSDDQHLAPNAVDEMAVEVKRDALNEAPQIPAEKRQYPDGYYEEEAYVPPKRDLANIPAEKRQYPDGYYEEEAYVPPKRDLANIPAEKRQYPDGYYEEEAYVPPKRDLANIPAEKRQYPDGYYEEEAYVPPKRDLEAEKRDGEASKAPADQVKRHEEAENDEVKVRKFDETYI